MDQYLIAHIGHTTKWCEHITWWKPDSCGYTFCIEKAGLYEHHQATSICTTAGGFGICIAVTKEVVQQIARSTPFYQNHLAEAARLYDGGDLVVVPNSPQAWRHLLMHRLDTGRIEKPTPIASNKARAFYLPEATRTSEREEQS